MSSEPPAEAIFAPTPVGPPAKRIFEAYALGMGGYFSGAAAGALPRPGGKIFQEGQ
jgi:hypothetical protein